MSVSADAPWLFARAATSPGALALRFEERELSWRDLARTTETLAARLHELGIGRGDLVALRMASHPRFVELFFALQALGATLLPLNRHLTDHELGPILAHASPSLLVDDGGECSLNLAGLRRVHPVEDLDKVSASKAFQLPTRLDVAAALTVVFTSGTTGTPKGVVLSNANYAASAQASRLRLGHNASDVWLATLPLFHVGGLSLLARSVLDGSSLVLTERFDADSLAAVFKSGNATMISVVPTMLERALGRLAARPSERLRAVLVGGAALSPSLGLRALEAGLPIAATYGMTEACSQICTSQVRSPGVAKGSVGLPLPGTEVRIEGADNEGWGDIHVRGPSVTTGYLNHPEANAAAWRDGWLITGDRGRLDEHGALFVAGRRSDLLVTGGENVAPIEVEQALEEHPDVAEALVFGSPDEQWGERVVAMVVLRDVAQAPDAAALQQWCRSRLASYKIPREIRFTDALPRSASGKLLRGSPPS